MYENVLQSLKVLLLILAMGDREGAERKVKPLIYFFNLLMHQYSTEAFLI